jgi:hypothetical protein
VPSSLVHKLCGNLPYTTHEFLFALLYLLYFFYHVTCQSAVCLTFVKCYFAVSDICNAASTAAWREYRQGMFIMLVFLVVLALVVELSHSAEVAEVSHLAFSYFVVIIY